ncbi:MAG: hypothetical protein IJI01_02110 [Butyrivibrio sp.]|uniref:hypothetical protein n=1 Tax=Butyrivibrio sp. TaxID=28121 RepID=UPI0025C1D57D|nr:hypothetical protein [Butyrivibrio sp.]MBQ6587455.1 hypothetical protein [Butyrivibrio sp.]
MNNCVIGVVFGKDKYKSFVPLYLYSINKAYPNTHFIIYHDCDVTNKYLKTIDEISNYKGGVEFRKIDFDKTELSRKALKNNLVKRALRWLILDDSLLEYDVVYVGDIDIFVCKETADMFYEHLRHCDFIGRSYSNIVRVITERKGVKHFCGNAIRFGARNALKNYIFPKKNWKALSGLHCFIPKEYIPIVLNSKKYIIDEINKAFEWKSDIWNPCIINDESILYEFIDNAGIGLDYIDPTKRGGVKLMENTNPESSYYRPHHGLHLHIFERAKPIDRELADSATYLAYFSYFEDLCKSNIELSEFIKTKNDWYCVKLLNNMCKYYRSEIISAK